MLRSVLLICFVMCGFAVFVVLSFVALFVFCFVAVSFCCFRCARLPFVSALAVLFV